MERPVRKQNRLQTIDYSENGAYFITICAKNKQKLFGEIVGGGALDAPIIRLSDVGKVVEKYIRSTNNIPEITVDKYVIMPNHIHLLLSVAVENGTSRAPSPTQSQQTSRTNQLLPHAISTLKRFVNRDVGYNVFQRSFYDHVVRGEQDYREIWQYIDTNPYKWQEDCFFCK
jgi:REP element-mobilizing transposase RayT